MALAPPVTIGELTNVPAPGSQIAAQWAQDATSRIVHRFANRTALEAWAAPAGSFAVTLDDVTLFRRKGGAWSRITPYTASATGVGLAGLAANTWTQVVTLTIPTEPSARQVDATWHLRYDRWPPFAGAARILVDGGVACQWDWQAQPEVAPPDGLVRIYLANLSVRNWPIVANKAIVVTGQIWCSNGTSQTTTYANGINNQFSISAVGV